MTENRFSGLNRSLFTIFTPCLFFRQVGFLISPVLPEHSGQYWCQARLGARTSEYGVNLNVLMQTR